MDLVIDETLERRWGSKISKRGHYRDSALSSRERSVSSPGLRWIVMAVVVTLPGPRVEFADDALLVEFPDGLNFCWSVSQHLLTGDAFDWFGHD